MQSPFTVADLTAMMRGTASYEGRYGEGGAARRAKPAKPARWPAPWRKSSATCIPDNTGMVYPAGACCAFNQHEPSDLWGRSAVGLDYTGQPYWWKPACEHTKP